MSAGYRRERRRPLPLGADSDVTPWAALEAALLGRRKLEAALRLFSENRLSDGFALLDEAQNQLDFSVWIIRHVIGEYQ